MELKQKKKPKKQSLYFLTPRIEWREVDFQTVPICALVQVSGGFAFFCLCVLSLLQVAAVYRDPSVGNLINIMIVKLVIVHNEQVSAGLECYLYQALPDMADVSAGVPGLAFSPRGSFWKDTACLVSFKSQERSPWRTNNTIVRQLATCEPEVAWETHCSGFDS